MNVDINFVLGFLFVANTMAILMLIRLRRKRFVEFIKKLYRERVISMEDRDFYLKEYAPGFDAFSTIKAFFLPKFEDVKSGSDTLASYQAFRRKTGLALHLSLVGLLIIAGLAAVFNPGDS